MRRFLNAVGRRFFGLLALVVVTYLISAQDLVRAVLDRIAGSERGQTAVKRGASFLAAHPSLIVPLGIVCFLAYCLYDSHFTGKPLLKVTAAGPMKGIGYIQAQRGGSKIVGTETYDA